MGNSKKYIIIFIVIVAIIFIISIYKVVNNHNDKLILVVENQIKEAAKDCYLHHKCENKIILQDLYDKKYLENIIDPITKKDMDKNKCIEYINDEVVFCS